jgi:hypothetical protein
LVAAAAMVATALPLWSAGARADLVDMRMSTSTTHHMGGMTTPSTTMAPTMSAGGESQTHNQHADLPQGPVQWQNPQTVASAALVRVETFARVDVSFHHKLLYHYRFKNLPDDTAVGTGVFINSRGAVLTSKSALHDDPLQTRRFGVRAVNETFHQAKLLPKLPSDPFKQVHLKDKALNVYLQSCYHWTTSTAHCNVFVTMVHRVVPSTSPPTALTGTPTSDREVAVLETTGLKHRPLTVQLGEANAGESYWAVASAGVNKTPKVVKGMLGADPDKPLSGKELDKLWHGLGAGGQGAPVISSRGDVVGIVNRLAGKEAFELVPAHHLIDDLDRFDVSQDSSPTDTDFRESLRLFEARQYRASLPGLTAAVKDAGGQLVPVTLAGQAKKLQNTAADLSDEANAHQAAPNPSGGVPGRVLVPLALVVLVAGLVGALVIRNRRTGVAGPSPEVAGAVPVAPAGAEHPPARAATDDPSAASNRAEPAAGAVTPRPEPLQPHRSVMTTVIGSASGETAEARGNRGLFCSQCGAKLSPGDRFCYSCGSPARDEQP